MIRRKRPFHGYDEHDGQLAILQDKIEELISCGCKVINPVSDLMDGLSNDEQVFTKWCKSMIKITILHS